MVEDIKKMISIGENLRALQLLIDYSTELSLDKIESDSIILCNEFHKLERDYTIRGIIQKEEYDVGGRKIMYSALEILDDLSKNENQESDDTKKNSHANFVKLEVNNLSLRVHDEDIEIISSLSFNVDDGDIIAVVGMNGVGKTSLLNTISGSYLLNQEGTISIKCNEHAYNNSNSNRILSYMTQNHLNWIFSIEETLTIVAKLSNMYTNDEIPSIVNKYLIRYDLINHKEKAWDSLSGGMKTRAILVKMTIENRFIYILDEPLAHLDSTAQRHFLEDIKRNINSDTTNVRVCIISSQHVSEVEAICDKILYLDRDNEYFYGTLNELNNKFEFNEYYIQLSGDYNNFKEMMNGYDKEMRVVVKSDHCLIRTDKKTSTNNLLKHISALGVKVTKFEDISFSSRRFK